MAARYLAWLYCFGKLYARPYDDIVWLAHVREDALMEIAPSLRPAQVLEVPILLTGPVDPI